MQLPSKTNPMGLSGCFTITVQPGILGQSLTYGFTPYFLQGGYCNVLDWGDGSSQQTVSQVLATHTYAAPGTYTISIEGTCYKIQFGQASIQTTAQGDQQYQQDYQYSYYPQNYPYASLVSHTNGQWSSLGNLTDAIRMFQNCSNMQQSISELPAQLVTANSMFYHCHKAKLNIAQIPQTLFSAINMFGHCHQAVLPLTHLPQRLVLTKYMFDNCYKAQLPIQNIPAEVTDARAMFQRCYQAQLYVTQLPTNLSDGTAMFFCCNNANLNIASIPQQLAYGDQMFRNCYKAQFYISKLPTYMMTAQSMFRQCAIAQIDVSQLAENAPSIGYQVEDIGTMFYHSPKVTGSRAAFLAACPNARDYYTFEGTATTDDVNQTKGTKLSVNFGDVLPPFIGGTYIINDASVTGTDRIWSLDGNSMYTIQYKSGAWHACESGLELSKVADGSNPWDSVASGITVTVIE